MQLLGTLDVSLPILLAVFSLCTSMLAVLGTVQLVVAPSQRPDVEVGLALHKRSSSGGGGGVPWWAAISPADSRSRVAITPLTSRPPLSMAKLIMLRHAETQRRANSRARMRFAQVPC